MIQSKKNYLTFHIYTQTFIFNYSLNLRIDSASNFLKPSLVLLAVKDKLAIEKAFSTVADVGEHVEKA